jgi:thioredoxin 1
MKELTQDNFEDNIGQGKAVVDFWAPWCGPCKVMAPHFEDASEEVDGVNFFKVNVDDNQATSQEYGVRSIPTVVFFKDGEEQGRVTGAMKKDKILESIDEYL